MIFNNTTLTLEDNLTDINSMNNYSYIKMIGCIFEPSIDDYFNTCSNCGLDIDDEHIHEILFDLNVKFLTSKVGNYGTPKNITGGIDKILKDHVYPGEFEIETNNYEIRYTKDDYFKIVNDIIYNSINSDLNLNSNTNSNNNSN